MKILSKKTTNTVICGKSVKLYEFSVKTDKSDGALGVNYLFPMFSVKLPEIKEVFEDWLKTRSDMSISYDDSMSFTIVILQDKRLGAGCLILPGLTKEVTITCVRNPSL